MKFRSNTICPICGKKNSTAVQFCNNCRYPINVIKLKDLTVSDLSTYAIDLATSLDKHFFKDKELYEIYDTLFHLNWLRPESALIRFVEAKILLRYKNKYLKYPLLDIGCGDGTFMLVLFGGRINRVYDIYENIDETKTDNFDKAAKFPVDIFVKRPSRIGFGIDVKKSSVIKARSLRCYERVEISNICTDKLPLPNSSCYSAFSNMIDDIKREDVEKVFREVSRILRRGGYFVFTTPILNYTKSLLYYTRAMRYKKDGNISLYKQTMTMDRGRSQWEERPLSYWSKIFDNTNFTLIDYVTYTDDRLLQFWDVGFRPFFSHLYNFRQILKSSGIFVPVKELLVNLMKNSFYYLTYSQEDGRKDTFAIIAVKKTV